MHENMIYVPLELFNEMAEIKGRVKAFEAYVKKSNYGIDRKDCAAMLGFELEDDGREV